MQNIHTIQCVTDQTNLTIRNKLFLLFVQRWSPVFRSEKDGSAVTHRIPQQLEEKKMMMVFRQWCLGGGAPLNDPDPTLTFQIRERWLGRNTPDSTTVGRQDGGDGVQALHWCFFE